MMVSIARIITYNSFPCNDATCAMVDSQHILLHQIPKWLDSPNDSLYVYNHIWLFDFTHLIIYIYIYDIIGYHIVYDINNIIIIWYHIFIYVMSSVLPTFYMVLYLYFLFNGRMATLSLIAIFCLADRIDHGPKTFCFVIWSSLAV